MSLNTFLRVIEAGNRVTFDLYLNGKKVNNGGHLSVSADQFSDLACRLQAGVGMMGASMKGDPARFAFYNRTSEASYIE